MKSPLPWLAIASCLILSSCDHSTSPVHKVTVIGTAVIKVAPDQMLWNVQINVDGTTLAAAKARHDASLTTTQDYIKSLGDAVKDFQTDGIRFNKQNYFPPDVKQPKPYSCSTNFTFTLTDFDKYGAIADELSKLDGVQVNSVDYGYSKQADVRRDALKQALDNAVEKANDLATTANCVLGAPLDIQEGYNDGPRPLMMNAMLRAAPGGTPPAVTGQIEINGTVTATYEIRPK